jgi:translation initiation factor IF-2
MSIKQDENNNGRSKLTLKLKSNSQPSEASVSKVSSKIFEKKKSLNAVQVTIKGRKKETSSNEESHVALTKNELEEKVKLVSQSNKINDDKKSNDVNKIIKEKRQEEELKKEKIEQEKADKESLLKNKEEPVEEKIEPKNDQQKIIKTVKFDAFDVRNKIKQSLEISNREKEERNKLVEERKKQEQEKKLEKQKLENEKKNKNKKPIKQNNSFEEENERKKGKINYKKEEKINTRKLTYIVGNEDEGDGYFKRRRKAKAIREEQTNKEYKKVAREVALPELITVSELAERMSEKAGDVVKKLFSMGVVATSNQVIDADTAEIIITEFGHSIKRVSHSDVEKGLSEDFDSNHELLSRPPIVTIMGHVDHGKTSLLDALRQTDIASGEHGGITQHIGASQIQTKDGKKITFLDTPGHEAFTAMRLRGANVTDIVVLVVAADDGVKEQTIEAINHAKAANVPIIVAVNKIDKQGSDPQRVKNELLSHDIVSEDLGGDVIFIPVSAKQKLNLDKLEETILLQAEMLDLKAPYEGKASGVVIESRIDPAKGVVVTLLVQKGCLNVSDLIIAGISYGKIRKMTDGKGLDVTSALPATAVEILGLDSVPNAGDTFIEADDERQAREIISYRSRKEKEEKAMKNSSKSLASIFKESGQDKLKYLNVIVKGDVNGSIEAINGTIVKLSNNEVAIKVIHLATGGITETDIHLAAVSNAIIIGFNVRANSGAKELAKNKNVDIRYYSIIYNLVDDLKLILSGMLEPVKNEEYLGQAEIRQVFKVSGAGKIAGSFVIDGIIKRNAKVRLLRDNIVIHDGILKTLKRFKDDAKEVKSGFECGFSLENYEDIKEKDIIECYEIVEQKRII